LDFARKHFRGKKNVRFYCAAIGGSSGIFRLNIESDLSGSNSFHITTDSLRNMRYRKQIEVRMLTVTEFIKASGIRPTVLVLDVEGEEGAAIRGAEGFLPDRVFLETHWVRKGDGSFASTLYECEDYLSERGYLVDRFADRGGYVWLSGVRPRGS
jgi:FkbM family methyltransferase